MISNGHEEVDNGEREREREREEKSERRDKKNGMM